MKPPPPFMRNVVMKQITKVDELLAIRLVYFYKEILSLLLTKLSR